MARWRPDPHLPIEKLAVNLWRVEAKVDNPPLHRVMTVVKLADGRGLIHSAVMMEESSMRALEAWARPAILVVPSGFHRKDAHAYVSRYPSITVVCPSAARDRVAEKVKVDATYETFPLEDPSIRFLSIPGLNEVERVMEVRSPDGVTLVFNDLLFNMPHVGGLGGFVIKHVLQNSGGPKVSRLGRLWLIKDKAAVRAELEKLASKPDLVRVIVSHHEMITEQPADALRRVAASL